VIALVHELRTCSRIIKHELHPPNWHIKISSKDRTPLPYQVVLDFRLLGEIYYFCSLDCICVHTYKPRKSQKIQLGFRSSCPINHLSLCIVFSVCIVEFVSASACRVAGLSVCTIRVTSLNHPSHAAAARLHHCSTISFPHHHILPPPPSHYVLFFPPNFIRAFFRVCELSFGRQARGRRRAKIKISEKNKKQFQKKSQIRILVGLTRFLLVPSEFNPNWTVSLVFDSFRQQTSIGHNFYIRTPFFYVRPLKMLRTKSSI
jgi:hypothetical protein